MERVRERVAQAEKALGSLEAILVDEPTDVVRDAAIQRFEYTVEATWKAAQAVLRELEGLDAGSPKATIRGSFQAGLLDEEKTRAALLAVDDRNLTSHTYLEGLALQIHGRLKAHASTLRTWLAAMSARLRG